MAMQGFSRSDDLIYEIIQVPGDVPLPSTNNETMTLS